MSCGGGRQICKSVYSTTVPLIPPWSKTPEVIRSPRCGPHVLPPFFLPFDMNSSFAQAIGKTLACKCCQTLRMSTMAFSLPPMSTCVYFQTSCWKCDGATSSWMKAIAFGIRMRKSLSLRSRFKRRTGSSCLERPSRIAWRNFGPCLILFSLDGWEHCQYFSHSLLFRYR